MSWVKRIPTLRMGRAVRLAWESAPGWMAANVALVAVLGALPLLSALIMKQIVDAASAALVRPEGAAGLGQVGGWIVLAALVALVTAACRSLAGVTGAAHGTALTDKISDVLHAQSVLVDLEYYEDPRYHDTLHRAQAEALYRPGQIVNRLIQMGQAAVSLAGAAAVVLAFSPLLALALVAVALPGAAVRLAYSRKLFRFEQAQTENERRAWYYHWMLIDAGHAKEVRLYNVGALFRDRFRVLRQALRGGRLALTRRRALFDFLAQALVTLGLFGTLAFAASQALRGAITLGGLVMVYQVFQLGLAALQGILGNAVGLYEDNLFLANFYRFLDLTPAIRQPVHPLPVPARGREGIVFDRVSFTYTGGGRPALHEVSLALRPGEVIALVGENGSGKTTLIKLLCRLYDPGAGAITVEGSDLRDMDPVGWRRELGVIFQDYLHYHLSAAENIWLGDVDAPADAARIADAARAAGAETVIEGLPAGYETVLGQWFSGGRELSMGQWQKIALARAFYRDASCVVLDEPTSSLDPLAEAELFRQFRALIAGRSAILISHRFSTVQAADRIYVMHEGRIVEHGTHSELLQQDGRYARLYRAQADAYQPHGKAAAEGQA